jgi:hydroxyacylglutathione hydrolase
MPLQPLTTQIGQDIFVDAIPAFRDNWLWLLRHGQDCMVVDPGDAAPLLMRIKQQNLHLRAMLLTHHHPDHIGGVDELHAHTAVPVYCADEERIRIRAPRSFVGEGSVLEVDGFPLIRILHLPGHTRSHLGFALGNAVFLGDVLFGAGCGRVMENDYAAAWSSLRRLRDLPGHTRLYCAHEYTRDNLRFAMACDPHHRDVLQERYRTAPEHHAGDKASVPLILEEECASNPFLRCDEPGLVQSAGRHAGRSCAPGLDTFQVLRQWKNGFT